MTTTEYLNGSNVACLREVADRMGIAYTTKTRKPDLVAEIRAWIEVLHVEALIENGMRRADARHACSINTARIDACRRQNGSTRLTPRQARRIRHKENRAKRVAA